jgi:hypothetical protein
LAAGGRRDGPGGAWLASAGGYGIARLELDGKRTGITDLDDESYILGNLGAVPDRVFWCRTRRPTVFRRVVVTGLAGAGKRPGRLAALRVAVVLHRRLRSVADARAGFENRIRPLVPQWDVH